jgi:hypothetical protein
MKACGMTTASRQLNKTGGFIMKYYKVASSHWPGTFEFRSDIELSVGQCFRILASDGGRKYPTRFKVLEVNDTSNYSGWIVTMNEVDLTVDQF